MNLFNGRLPPQSLDAAYERHAMEQGLVDKPIFPENQTRPSLYELSITGCTPQAPSLLENVLQERGSRYGKFEDNARISQELKDVCASGQELNPVVKEALDNICQKIARVVNGDQFYEDNWVDIQGYAKLALDYIRERK